MKKFVSKLASIFKPRFIGSEKLRAFSDRFERFAIPGQYILALVLVFILEWMSRHSFVSACGFVRYHFIPYLYNAFIIFVFYSIAFLVPFRLAWRAFVSFIFFLLGLTNSIILANRVSPFGLTDIDMIGDLLTMKNSKYMSTGQILFMIIIVLIVFLGIIRLFIHGPRYKSKRKFFIRLIATAAVIAVFWPATLFLQRTGLMASYFGNLAQGYLDYGYLYGFETSIVGRGIKKPIGYSKAKIKSIIASDDNGKTTMTEKTGPNIIIVLLESYFDPSECKYIETSEDPIPYFHELEENYSSGHLKVPVVGAGTCNTEFEVLTGMSCSFFGPGEYPQKTVLKKNDCESIADILDNMNYGTHVVHNNGGNFYSRKNAFSQMGFDTFTCKETLDITDYTPLKSWPTDDILIDATKDAMDSTKTKDLVYTITVGTHGAYPGYKVLDDPAIKVKAKGQTEEKQYMWEYYINQLHTMDQWIHDYIDMLNSRNEDTLVIMFGDHLPTMGLTNQDVTTGDIFKTKYITWNNFGMKKQDQDLASYQLVSEYLGRLGVHDGTIVNYNQKKISEGVKYDTNAYMDNLHQLQYDLLYGKRYAYNGKDKYPASDIVMGIKDVTINRMYLFNGQLHIYGDNFSKWSKVYVNGKKQDTGYKSGQCLTIDASELKDGDKIVVNQLGSNDTIFRTSNSMTFHDPELTKNNKDANDPTQEGYEPAGY